MITSGLDIVSRVNGGVVRLVVSGELDLATAPELLRHTEEARDSAEPPVELDLAGLTFIDASHLRRLLAVEAGLRCSRRTRAGRGVRSDRRLCGLAGLSGRLVAGALR